MKPLLTLSCIESCSFLNFQLIQQQLSKSIYDMTWHAQEWGYFRSLGFYQPVTEVKVLQVRADSILSWLASPEGPVLVEAQGSNKDTPDEDTSLMSRGLVFAFSPHTI